MLGSGSGRWSTYQQNLGIFRFFVFPAFTPRGCLLQSFSSARRESSNVSARACLRQNAAISVPRRPRLGNNDDRNLPNRIQESVRQGTNKQECKSKTLSTETLRIPKDLLKWVGHFASDPSHRESRRIEGRQAWMRFLNDAESVCQTAERLVKGKSPQYALYILRAAHSIGMVYKQNVYERIVYHFAIHKEWDLVLSSFTTAINATGKTTVRLLNWRGRALMEMQNYAELHGLIGEFASYGLMPQRRTFTILLQGHLRNHDLTRAKATIRDMERAGFRVDPSTYTAIIPAYRGFGMDDFVQDRGQDVLGNQTARGKEKILNGLLRLHLDKQDLEGALQLLEAFGTQMKRTEEEQAAIAADDGDHDPGTSLQRDATLTDRATYTILIDYFSKHSNRSRSLGGILQRMSAVGIKPDIRLGVSLIRLHYTRGEEHEAIAILRDCCRPHKLPKSLLVSLGYDPRYPEPSAFAPYEGKLSVELFNRVLQGAIQSRGLLATTTVLKLMKCVQVEPDAQTLEIFLWYLTKEKRVMTKDLANILTSLFSSKLQPTLPALNTIFEMIVRSAKASKHTAGWDALATYVQRTVAAQQSPVSKEALPHEMEESILSFDPDVPMNDLQLLVFRSVLQPIIMSLRQRQFMADRATFHLRMRCDAFTLPPTQAVESVIQKLQIMRDRGLYANVYHYTALMEAHCAAGDIDTAHDVLQDAVGRGVVTQRKSHVIMYTILITAYARIGRPDLALSVFREIINADVSPDAAAVDAVVGAFFGVKAFQLARRVLLNLWPMVAPFPKELRDASLSDMIARLRAIRNKVELPQPDVKKRVALSRPELMELIENINSEWKKLVNARAEIGRCDDAVNAPQVICSDAGKEVETQCVDIS